MILSDSQIKKQVKKGKITISPFNEEQINPNSYDLKLGNIIKIYKDEIIDNIIQPLDPKKEHELLEMLIPEEGLVLVPGQLYLGYTEEIAGSCYYHSQLKGKSSLARLGIFIDCTASWGDCGFVNNWTLEISVIKPVKIYPSMRIAQIIFTEVSGEVLIPYNKKKDSKYNTNNKAQKSLYFKNY